MARNRIEIGKEVRRIDADRAPLHTSIRPVTVRNGRTVTVDGYFRTCNGGATFALGECSDGDFEFVVQALGARSAKELARMLP